MINWVKSLNDAQKGAINAVIDEQIKDSNKFLYEIVKAALNISTDYTEDEINSTIEFIKDLSKKFKHSTGDIMNATQCKKIEDECTKLMEKDIEATEAIDILHTSFPGTKANELIKIYKKVRAEYLKPKVKVDMDIELKQFDEKHDKLKMNNKKNYEKLKAKKQAAREKEEKETMSNSTKTKFKVVEKTIKLESELGNYTVSKDKISTDCINGVMTTFTSKDEAKKLIGKLLDKLMDLDKEIQEIWETYVNDKN